MQYESEFLPKPTPEQESALSNYGILNPTPGRSLTKASPGANNCTWNLPKRGAPAWR